jgi:MFS family permease
MTPPADTQPPGAPPRAPAPESASGADPEAGAPSRAGLIGRARAEFRVFPRQFWLLAFGFFVLLSGIDMCFPFETTYLHDRLGISMTTIGLLLGVPLLIAIPVYILDGVITDRYGRKPAMIVGVCFVAVLYSTLALSGVVWHIAVAVSLEAAFGWALFLTGSNAMIADLVPIERRAEAYGITRVALHIGMVAGPLIGAVIIARDPTYRSLFLTGVSICVVFILLVVFAFRETRPAAARAESSIGETVRGYGHVLRDRRFLAFCAIAFLPLYAFGQIWSTLPVMLRNAQGMPVSTWGYVVAFYALGVVVFQYPMIRLLRKKDHVLLMAAASALIGLGLGGAVLVPWGALTFASMFVLGQGALLLIPISSTVSAEMAPVALRGRYMGTWTLVQQAGYALGPTFGGMAMDGLGEQGAALVIVACGLTGATLYVALARRFRLADAAAEAAALDVEEAPPAGLPGA